MDLRQLLICGVLLLGGISLLQFEGVTYRKIGMVMIWLASGLAAYFLSGSVALGCTMLAAWIFFPLWEIVFILRQLRLPRHSALADARPPRDEFEELGDVTHELNEAGFQQVDECSLHPVEHQQYYRIFVRHDGFVQATVGYIAQGAIGFHFVAFSSDSADGRRWITWDYPLTYGLIMPPNTAVFRLLDCHDIAELYQAHLDFLKINEVDTASLVTLDPLPDAARARLEETLNQQIEYNVSRGYLAPAANRDKDNFCYSWRGTLYVAGQVMRDIFF